MIVSYQAPPELIAILKKREGDKARAYKDSKGIWTAGIGRNLENPGLSKAEVIALLQLVDLPESIRDLMLSNDLEALGHQVAGVVGDATWGALAPARQAALIDMGMMGPAKLAGFRKMLAAVSASDWPTAAQEARASGWAKDVGPGRTNEVAAMLFTGDWPDA